MICITDEQRRARLGRRHHLASPAAKVERATSALIGLHSSDPASVFLSARARVKNFQIGDLERALYDRRSLVRMLGMRRTMFVVDRDAAAVMDAACTQELAPAERRKLVQLVGHQGHAADGAKWLRRVEQLTVRALDELGEATASELSSVVPELKLKLTMGEGKKWGGDFGISTRVLFLLATKGGSFAPVRGDRGSRVSTAGPRLRAGSAPFRIWTAGGHERIWCGAGSTRSNRGPSWTLRGGPAGTNAAQARPSRRSKPSSRARVRSATRICPARRPRPHPLTETWVALLPALDPTVMGWKQRDWYLGRHTPRLFDRNGNAGPTVWVNGRIVGGWGQRPDGTVVVQLLDEATQSDAVPIDREARALAQWLGGTRVTPRFRTPVEKELSTS